MYKIVCVSKFDHLMRKDILVNEKKFNLIAKTGFFVLLLIHN